jgi:hypothetical protein
MNTQSDSDGLGWYHAVRELIYCLDRFGVYYLEDARELSHRLKSAPRHGQLDGPGWRETHIQEQELLTSLIRVLSSIENHGKANLSIQQRDHLEEHLDLAIIEIRKQEKRISEELKAHDHTTQAVENYLAELVQTRTGKESEPASPESATSEPVSPESAISGEEKPRLSADIPDADNSSSPQYQVMEKPPRVRAELTAVDRAMIIFAKDPNQTIREVARKVGCHPSLLSRNEKFQNLRSAYMGTLPIGTKSKDRNLEAQADDD